MLTFSGRPTRAILIIGMCLYSQADFAKLCITLPCLWNSGSGSAEAELIFQSTPNQTWHDACKEDIYTRLFQKKMYVLQIEM